MGVLLALGLSWAWFQQSEPKYEGRTLTQWFAASQAERADRPSADEYHSALRALGTNDFPALIRRISFDPDHCFAKRLIDTLPGIVTPRGLEEYLLDRKWQEDAQATYAVEVFQALGPQGAPAIQELAKIAMHGAVAPAHRAVDCLGYIGGDALPALIMVATNTQPQSFRAFGWLLAYTNSPQAMQIVAQHPEDPRVGVLGAHATLTTSTNSPTATPQAPAQPPIRLRHNRGA